MSKFIKKPKNFLVFIGGPGIGKTHFCSCLIPWALQNFNSFRYFDEKTLHQRLRDCIHSGSGEYSIELSLLTDDDLIILDDVASEKVNEWREDVFFNFLDERYKSMKPTIITSNLSRKKFQETYHPRIVSRLFATENTIIELPDAVDQRSLGK